MQHIIDEDMPSCHPNTKKKIKPEPRIYYSLTGRRWQNLQAESNRQEVIAMIMLWASISLVRKAYFY